MEHHLVLHDDALVPERVLESDWRLERTVRPVGEGAVLTEIPPGDDLSHLLQVAVNSPDLPMTFCSQTGEFS